MCTYPFGAGAPSSKELKHEQPLDCASTPACTPLAMPTRPCDGSALTDVRNDWSQADCFADMHMTSSVYAACVAQAPRGVSWAASWRCCGRPPWGGTPSAQAPAWPSASAAMAVSTLLTTCRYLIVHSLHSQDNAACISNLAGIGESSNSASNLPCGQCYDNLAAQVMHLHAADAACSISLTHLFVVTAQPSWRHSGVPAAKTMP
jgi:hypothetical protein